MRPGMLFRASSLHRLTDEEAWREFGAATVIDLRYQSEIDAFPLPDFIEDATHAPVLLEGWQRGREDLRREDDPAEHLAWVYEVMLELGQDTIRRILGQLVESGSTPAIFFCMAGKDRTGFVAAVLLSLLGVSDEDIADDFALSGDEVVALVKWLKTREDFEQHPMMNQSDGPAAGAAWRDGALPRPRHRRARQPPRLGPHPRRPGRHHRHPAGPAPRLARLHHPAQEEP